MSILALVLGCTPPAAAAAPRGTPVEGEATIVPRPLDMDGSRTGIAYGPHRDGQRPGGPSPSRDQLRVDLHLIAKRWPVLRLYGAAEIAPTVLDLIREERMPVRVLLGVGIAADSARDSSAHVFRLVPGAAEENRREVEAAVRLARAYPSEVRALVVGNETQVYWTATPVPRQQLVAALREVRSRVSQPVTTCDDFAFWERPESRALGEEVDFVMVNLHPLWNGSQLDTALTWVARHYALVQGAHPGRPVMIGETGWATRHNQQGDQGKLMKGATGEREQAQYLEELDAWLSRSQVPTLVFEAFDENWKGGADSLDVEKHWGVYRADRTPKAAARRRP